MPAAVTPTRQTPTPGMTMPRTIMTTITTVITIATVITITTTSIAITSIITGIPMLMTTNKSPLSGDPGAMTAGAVRGP